MTRAFLLAFFTVFGATAQSETVSEMNPTHLRCEYRSDPLGIDVKVPRLSWVLVSGERGQVQSAYRVLVASSPEVLAKDAGDLWDSAKVASDRTVQIAYEGATLKSRMACWWKVRIWDRDGRPSRWSEPARWTMGLMEPADWQAQWIAADKPMAACAAQPYELTIDLGVVEAVDLVVFNLTAANNALSDDLLFPLTYVLEGATAADFSDAVMLMDRRGEEFVASGRGRQLIKTKNAKIRFLRLKACKLARREGMQWAGILQGIEVYAGQRNVATNAAISCTATGLPDAWDPLLLVKNPQRRPVHTRPLPSSAPVQLRKEFAAKAPVRKAIMYATALGLYETHLNGVRVGDWQLAPECTRTDRRIQYQTYDVTSLIQAGANAWSAHLAEGWYGGRMLFRDGPAGYPMRMLAQLEISYMDGTREMIMTDESWRVSKESPIRMASIYDGETHDARLEPAGWMMAGFDASHWVPAAVVGSGAPEARLVSQPNEPIRVVQDLEPVAITDQGSGRFLLDFGQNLVGWCRLKVAGPAGTTITLRYAEMLSGGNIYTANLRKARQTASYTMRGEGIEIWEPRFTYFGFRYVEVQGWPGRLEKSAITARVVHSDAGVVGTFACSNDLLNRLMSNIVWTQRGNMHSVPTDCPQRDERLGWTGDIQAFSQTAIYNMDMAAFFTKWVPDMRDSQADDGRYPDFAPSFSDVNKSFSGVPAWGDAGTVVPWRMYQNYADTNMLQEHLASARRWVDWIRLNNPGMLWGRNRGSDYGDWLNGDVVKIAGFPEKVSEVPKDVFATAFFAHSAQNVAKMARVLGRSQEAEQYEGLFAAIRTAFQKAYVDAEGRIKGDTQAGYALALHFELLDEAMQAKAVTHLLTAIERYKGHASTGIQSSHRMLLELSARGHHDEAYRLATLRSAPSWGYSIDQGATTIWERWDGYVEGRGFQVPTMNSFNHYALGSVGEWMWRELAGIQPDETQPGYKHFVVRPRPAGDLLWVKARYESIRGPIECHWDITDEVMTLTVTVPANTTATIHIPTTNPERVTESGKLIGRTVHEVGSGRYRYVAPYRAGNSGHTNTKGDGVRQK